VSEALPSETLLVRLRDMAILSSRKDFIPVPRDGLLALVECTEQIPVLIQLVVVKYGNLHEDVNDVVNRAMESLAKLESL